MDRPENIVKLKQNYMQIMARLLKDQKMPIEIKLYVETLEDKIKQLEKNIIKKDN